jgi:DNA-binding GntR family transcriptional regulator
VWLVMQTLQQRAYEHIRKRLLCGELPPGSRVSERTIAQQIGMSRTPVREALNKLSSDGLLEYVDGAGMFTKMPTRRELEDLYELRIWLECGAMTRVVERISDAMLAELDHLCMAMRQVAVDLGDAPEGDGNPEASYRWLMLDTTFHVTLLRAADNPTAMKMVSDLRMMSQVFGHQQCSYDSTVLGRIITEHEAIVGATRDRDVSQATDMLTKHIRRGLTFSLDSREARLRQQSTGDILPSEWPQSIAHLLHDIESGRAVRADDVSDDVSIAPRIPWSET